MSSMLNNFLEGFIKKKSDTPSNCVVYTKVLSTLVVTFYMVHVTLVLYVTDHVRFRCGPYRVNIITHVMAFSARVGPRVSK